MNSYTPKGLYYIYFIQWKDDLPDYFFHLASFFNSLGVHLVPVTPSDFVDLSHEKREIVISVCPDLYTYKKFSSFRSGYLDHMVLKGKFTLIDVNSFSPVEYMSRAQKNKSYYHYNLPVHVETLVKDASIILYKSISRDINWPGGRRAKLPSA